MKHEDRGRTDGLATASSVLDEGSQRATISAIIPACNEAPWLKPNLQILTDNVNIVEIIVADNASTDQTAFICSMYRCRCVPGGLPASARNQGRLAARSDLLLFLDADSFLSAESLAAAVKILASCSRTSCVSFRVKPLSRSWLDQAAYLVAFAYSKVMCKIGRAQGLGNAMLVRASAFDRIGGFSERRSVGEDADLLLRLVQAGDKVDVPWPAVVWTSPRRLRLEGRVFYFSKVLFWAILRVANLKVDPLKYQWQTGYPSHWALDDIYELEQRGLL